MQHCHRVVSPASLFYFRFSNPHRRARPSLDRLPFHLQKLLRSTCLWAFICSELVRNVCRFTLFLRPTSTFPWDPHAVIRTVEILLSRDRKRLTTSLLSLSARPASRGLRTEISPLGIPAWAADLDPARQYSKGSLPCPVSEWIAIAFFFLDHRIHSPPSDIHHKTPTKSSRTRRTYLQHLASDARHRFLDAASLPYPCSTATPDLSSYSLHISTGTPSGHSTQRKLSNQSQTYKHHPAAAPRITPVPLLATTLPSALVPGLSLTKVTNCFFKRRFALPSTLPSSPFTISTADIPDRRWRLSDRSTTPTFPLPTHNKRRRQR